MAKKISNAVPRVRARVTPQSRSPAPGEVSSDFNKATARILRVLSAFAQPHESLGVSELSRSLGLSKNLIFRALATLMAEGYVMRDAEGSRYSLGYRLFELCTTEYKPTDIRALCAPYLQRIHELSGETVMLSIRVGGHSVVVDGIEGRGPLLSRVTHGHPIPLHAGPGSRAILSFLPDDEIRQYIEEHKPLARFSRTTLVQEKALWADIKLVREKGYALGYRDHLTGVLGVAFPLFDSDHRVHGAISVGGPEDQFTGDMVKKIIPVMKTIVEDLNTRSQLLAFAGG
jgi:DNA-binding IclR family transcriptional regulator